MEFLMKSKNVASRSFWVHLIITLCSIIVLFSLVYRFHEQQSNNHIKKLFEKELHEKNASLNKIADEIIGSYINNKMNSSEDWSTQLNSINAMVYLFERDSLVYWSSNLIDPEDIIVQEEHPIVRLSNGWYKISQKGERDIKLVAALLVKNEYEYHNEYLIPNFISSASLNENYTISIKLNDLNIQDDDGKFLFSIIRGDQKEIKSKQSLVLFIFYQLTIVLLLSLIIKFYKAYGFLVKKTWLIPYLILFDYLLLWTFLKYVQIPSELFESYLFSPATFADSLYNSIGDLFVNSIFFLFVAYSLSQFRETIAKKQKFSQLVRVGNLIILISSFFILFYFYEYIIISLFKNSQVSIEFGQDFIAHRAVTIISFFIACSFSLAIYFFGRYILIGIYKQFHKGIQRYLVGAGVVIGYGITSYVFSEFLICTVILIGGFTFLILFLEEKDSKITSLQIISFLLMFALYLGFLSADILTQKELEQRSVIAESVAGDRDPMAEYIFEQLIDKIKGDSIILKMVYQRDNNNELNIIQRIQGFFNAEASINFIPRITICDSTTILNFNTDDYMVSCATYFSEMISEFGNATNNNDLFYFRNNSINNSYIIRLFFPPINKSAGSYIFIELDSEFIQEGLGYPELLIDETSNMSGAELVNYSLAKYKNNQLVYKFGDYDYSVNLQYYDEIQNGHKQFDSNGYNHILINKDEETSLIISKENKDLIDILAPFSYFFIFLALFLACFYIITGFSFSIFNVQISFRNRLQFTLFSIILTSFLVIGITTLIFLIHLNDKKNNEILSEKAHSVLIELDHKLAGADSISSEMYETLNEWLGKFSLVFFSDINLYSLEGRLIASSRLPIFDVGLVSKLMNVTAYDVLANKEKLLFIQHEKIGKYEYLSAYVPFRNSRNKLIAYLNLPYFARQKELQTEITSFLVALINIYVLFFVIALLVTIFISRRISKPLLLIRQSISGIRLGKSNEKIKWVRKDEIGGLVTEYNRMIDELSKSANLLARSERESAWREMAKQVAHEIKNPLTPLKLSVQYLKKAWDDNEKDWDQRLIRFAKTSIEQIDSLSDIAGAFSDFAKMPVQKMEPVDLKKIIYNTVELFKENTTVEYVLHLPENEYIIIADKNQILRIFNNLFKNSIQALLTKKDGQITISVKKSNSKLIVMVADNGSGISKEMSDKIFTPSFTTKTSGMGLGLAIVRNIILNTGGDIWFESEAGVGSTFYISFPLPISEEDVV